jgi:hypothetical protein
LHDATILAQPVGICVVGLGTLEPCLSEMAGLRRVQHADMQTRLLHLLGKCQPVVAGGFQNDVDVRRLGQAGQLVQQPDKLFPLLP